MRHSGFLLSWLNLKIVILVRAAMQRKMRKHPKDHWMHRAGRSFYLFFAIIAAGQKACACCKQGCRDSSPR